MKGEVSPASGSGPQLKALHYRLTRAQQNGAEFTFLEPSGRVVGLPPKHQLHSLLWTDPESRDGLGKPGNNRYSWEPAQQLTLDEHGCWRLPQSVLGYAGSPGLDYRFEVAMLPDSRRPCLDDLHKNENVGDNFDDLGNDQLAGCGLVFLGSVEIPT